MQDTTLPVRLLQFSFSAVSHGCPDANMAAFLESVTTTSEMSVLLVQDGSLQVNTKKDGYTLSQGDILFLNSHQTYQLTDVERKDTKADLLLFNPDFMFSEFDTSLTSQYLLPFLKSAHCSSFLLPEGEAQLSYRSICDSIRVLLDEKPFAYELSCRELLCKLYRMILTYSRERTSAVQSKRTSSPSSYDITRIKEALAFFQENYMNPIALNEIADAIHLSISECCRCFRRTVDATPIEYLNKFRIMESIKKMKAGDAIADNISNLAYSVGFNSPSYYNQIFRRYFDCTPSIYKRKFIPAFHPQMHLYTHLMPNHAQHTTHYPPL
jgi:AraC-like DNA-binding protein